jgi:hypothetical protein
MCDGRVKTTTGEGSEKKEKRSSSSSRIELRA